jgi:hypothetical protein
MAEDSLKLVLHDPKQGREQMVRAWEWLHQQLKDGKRLWVSIKPATRSMEQNNMMWSVLTDLSKQCEWVVDGRSVRLPPEDVKHILTAALKQHQRMALIPGGGVVMLGQSTSKMTKSQMSDLITLGHAWGDERGVKWSRTSLGRDWPDEVTA